MGLAELPASIGQLAQLQQLYLFANQLTALPETIGQLAQLQRLEVDGNRLTALPEAVGQLVQLEHLFVSSNQVTALPEAIGQLAKLQSLHVSDNQLTALPHGLRRLTGLRLLFLHDNPALGLPPEILGPTWEEVLYKGAVSARPTNPASILDYYFKMRGGRRPLNEVRLLLMGRGAAGKTSIVRRLIENTFTDGEPETQGIDIRPWELQCGKDTVRAHVWDFAGQVITHATHQFFLSPELLT